MPASSSSAPPSVAVVLINWNGVTDTLATLRSLDRVRGASVRSIVVDNGSTDDSVERLHRERPDVELLETGKNLGFAGGNLVGFRHALADPTVAFVLALNTDVEVDPDFLTPLIQACGDPGVGAAGPKIFYFDPPDRIWAAGGRLRWRETVTQEFGQRRLDGAEFSQAKDVTYLTTCCLLMPRRALERVGLLDPVFFINIEDADWCRRALDAGLRLRYEPASRIWHKVAVATGGGYTPMKTFHTGRSNALFARRHGRGLGLAIFLLTNAVALPLAAIREWPRGRLKSVAAKARGVWRGLRDPLPVPPGV